MPKRARKFKRIEQVDDDLRPLSHSPPPSDSEVESSPEKLPYTYRAPAESTRSKIHPNDLHPFIRDPTVLERTLPPRSTAFRRSLHALGRWAGIIPSSPAITSSAVPIAEQSTIVATPSAPKTPRVSSSRRLSQKFRRATTKRDRHLLAREQDLPSTSKSHPFSLKSPKRAIRPEPDSIPIRTLNLQGPILGFPGPLNPLPELPEGVPSTILFSAPVGREVYKRFASADALAGPQLVAPRASIDYPTWWKTQPRVPILPRPSTPSPLPTLSPPRKPPSGDLVSPPSRVVPDLIPTQSDNSVETVKPPPPPPTPKPTYPRIFKHRPKRAVHYPTDFEFDLFYEPETMTSTITTTGTTSSTTTTTSGTSSTTLTYSTVYVPPFASSGAIFDGTDNPSDFLHRYSLLASSYGWDDDTKLRNFGHHLTNYPAAWLRIYADGQAEKKIPLTWAETEKQFRTVFSSKDTPESLHRQIRLVKFKGNTQKYLYELLPLLRKLDPKMSDDKLVRYLIKGCPAHLAEIITMSNPTNFETVEQLLLQSEKFHSMYPTSGGQDDEDNISRAMRRLELRSRGDESSLAKKSAHFHQVEMEPPELPCVQSAPKPNNRGQRKRPIRNAPINIIFTERGNMGYNTRGRGRGRSNNFGPQRNTPQDAPPNRARSPGPYQNRESSPRGERNPEGRRDSPSRNNEPSLRSLFTQARGFRREDGQGPCFECLEFGHFARDCPTFRQRLNRARYLVARTEN